MSPLQESIHVAQERIAAYLDEHKTATSWQLKIAFRLSSSVLYMALGSLYEQGKITLEADDINYKVSLAGYQPQPELQPQPQEQQA